MKRFVLFLLCCFAFIGVASFAYHSVLADPKVNTKSVNSDEINASGKALADNAKKYRQELKDEKIIAKINGEPIYQKEYALKKVMLETKASVKGTNTPSKKEIFNAVLNDKQSAILAKQYNVYPSEQDIQNYINNIRKSVNESDNPEALIYFTQNFGISEDEYWNEWAVPLYTQDLININLGNALKSQVTQNPSESQEDYMKRVTDNYLKVKENAKKNEKVEVIDKELGI